MSDTLTDTEEQDEERIEVEPIEEQPEPETYTAEPLYQLPEINGVIPVKLVGKLKSAKTDRLARWPHRGERIVLVVEVLAGDWQLNRKDELIQSLDVEDIYPLGEDRGQDLLREARTSYRVAEDQRLGREPLPFDETEAPTAFVAADGTVMLASEVAAVQGVTEARGVDIDPAGDVLTVEFTDGQRGLWPDDWAGSGQSLACVGGWMRPPGARDTAQVARFRDVDGDVVDEWKPEDEAARLSQLEQDVAAAEAVRAAREDREAAEQLEAGRGKGTKGRAK